jgi:CheY-like chemotaxis protein
MFSETDFDVAFMDVMMPGMNGVESFFEIRKMKPDAKVFMMTGYSIQQLLDQAIDHGALGVLNKPVDVVRILDILEEVQPRGIILVADDDPDFGEGIKAMLMANNYNVVLVQDGQEAVDKVANGGVDVLILDLKLPVLDGLEVYTKLKEKHCEVPTIIVTGHAAEKGSDIEALRDMSVTGVLTKPFEPPALLETLQQYASE